MLELFLDNIIDEIESCLELEQTLTGLNIASKINSTARIIDNPLPEIRDVIFNDPATIVFWDDGTKTIVKCQKDKGDVYNKEMGLAMCIVKKLYGNKGAFNEIFDMWCRDE